MSAHAANDVQGDAGPLVLEPIAEADLFLLELVLKPVFVARFLRLVRSSVNPVR